MITNRTNKGIKLWTSRRFIVFIVFRNSPQLFHSALTVLEHLLTELFLVEVSESQV